MRCSNSVMKVFSIILLLGLSSGCVMLMPIDESVPRVFRYEYQIPETSKPVLWSRARNYFLDSFEDDEGLEFKVSDKENGTLIGRASVYWKPSPLNEYSCYSTFKVRFFAKENKALVQFELLDDTTSGYDCSGWSVPSNSGYQTIKTKFETTHMGLEKSLRGEGSTMPPKGF